MGEQCSPILLGVYMSNFFINNNQIKENKIIISGQDVNHIKKVLRKKVGDIITISNGKNKEYKCEINKIMDEYIETCILEEIVINQKDNVIIDLYQGLPKGDKMELIIQKTTELGINKIIPVITKRVVVKLDDNSKIKKVQRWQRIAEEAAKQCKRIDIPKIDNVTYIKDLVENLEEYDIVLLAYEDEKHEKIRELITNIKQVSRKIAIIIGPEGGFEKEEIDYLLKNKKVKSISLGDRILRTETAGLVVTAILKYEFGEI